MKFIKLLFLLLCIAVCGCEQVSHNIKDHDGFDDIKNIEVAKSILKLDGNKGIWYYNEKPFSGYAVSYHTNNTLREKIGFSKGRKEGVAQIWFINGVLKVESHYKQNKLVSSYKSWWDNGVLSSEVTYIKGKKQGVEKTWYNTGVLSKERNLVGGQENGLQKAWLKNGKLYVNYEAKNGRAFGMRRANSCYRLEDEVVVLKRKR